MPRVKSDEHRLVARYLNDALGIHGKAVGAMRAIVGFGNMDTVLEYCRRLAVEDGVGQSEKLNECGSAHWNKPMEVVHHLQIGSYSKLLFGAEGHAAFNHQSFHAAPGDRSLEECHTLIPSKSPRVP